ncbi:MAG: copper chaperone PCu(A)C [Piscinibacter sp.]|uniref:copper chaperone PCu(A)C n=1 Tax=Piscinibacter sp. TaxID=1903157 RepID=UPI003D0B7433
MTKPPTRTTASLAAPDLSRRKLCAVAALAVATGVYSPGALAHGTRAGDLTIDHPYATPTPDGARTGAVYFRTLINRGKAADRLVGARTERAESAEIHRSVMEGDLMRMRAVDGIDIPPGAELKLRHAGDIHLMLLGLRSPLRDGQRFSLWLRFERAGEHEVTVWVQTPRDAPAHRH